jgi:CheY-like chemotaxis protein
MALNGPILIIEDDSNDADVIMAAIKELGVKNELKNYIKAQDAIDYLMVTTDKPLVILCDIRMPELDGMAMLKHISNTEYLRRKSIPFIFLTEIASKEIINEAYNIGVQGFFKKQINYTSIKEQLLSILVYWEKCLHPNADDIV